MEDVETVRARFRPERITTLFVGESAFKSLGSSGKRGYF